MDGVLIRGGVVIGTVYGYTTETQRAAQLQSAVDGMAAEEAQSWTEGSRPEHLRLARIERYNERIAVLSAWPDDVAFQERSLDGVAVGDPA